MANIGKIAVQLSASTGQFIQGMTQASSVLKRFSQANAAFTKNPFKFLGGAAMSTALSALQKMEQILKGVVFGATAAAGAFALFTKSAIDGISELFEGANRIGVTTDALAELRYAARLAGIEAASFDGRIQKMMKSLSSAATGKGADADIFKSLGLNAKALRDGDMRDAFFKIGQAITDVQNPADKLRYTLTLFGRDGANIINLFADGAKTVKAMASEAKLLGLSISSIDASKVEAAGDGLEKIKAGLGGFFDQMAVKFAPFITDATNRILEWIKSMGGIENVATQAFNSFGGAAENAINFTIKAMGGLIAVVDTLRAAWHGVSIAVLEAAVSTKKIAWNMNGIRSPFARMLESFTGEAETEDQALIFVNSLEADIARHKKAFWDIEAKAGSGGSNANQFTAYAKMGADAVTAWAKGVAGEQTGWGAWAKAVTDAQAKEKAKGNFSNWVGGVVEARAIESTLDRVGKINSMAQKELANKGGIFGLAAFDQERLKHNTAIAKEMWDQADAAKELHDLQQGEFGVGNRFLTAFNGPALKNPIASAATSTPGMGKDAVAGEVMKQTPYLMQIAANTARPAAAVAV